MNSKTVALLIYTILAALAIGHVSQLSSRVNQSRLASQIKGHIKQIEEASQ